MRFKFIENALFINIIKIFLIFILVGFVFLIFKHGEFTEHQFYVQYECVKGPKFCGGWADRLKGIMGAYALSLLLNRTFQMKITYPCDFNYLLQANRVSSWNKSLKGLRTYNLNFRYKLELLKEFETIDFLKVFRIPFKSKVLRVRSGIQWSNSLSKNPHLVKRLNELGFNETNKFKISHQMYKWYNDLFKMSYLQERRYEELLKKLKPNNNTFLVCAQLRVGGQTYMQGKEDFTFGDTRTITKFKEFINKQFLDQYKNYTNDINNIRMFITSDLLNAKETLGMYLQNSNYFFWPEGSGHIDKDYDRDFKETPNIPCHSTVENVIIEFHVMQHCDAMVISHSGYGILASWNRPDPTKHFYVLTKPNQTDLRKDYLDRKDLDFVKINNLDDLYYQ